MLVSTKSYRTYLVLHNHSDHYNIYRNLLQIWYTTQQQMSLENQSLVIIMVVQHWRHIL